MYGGTFIESGTIKDVFRDPKHEYTKMLLNTYKSLMERKSNCSETIKNTVKISSRYCPFLSSCKRAMNICFREFPVNVGNERHLVRCWENYSLSFGGLL